MAICWFGKTLKLRRKNTANGEVSDTDKDYIGHGTPRYSLSWGIHFDIKDLI